MVFFWRLLHPTLARSSLYPAFIQGSPLAFSLLLFTPRALSLSTLGGDWVTAAASLRLVPRYRSPPTSTGQVRPPLLFTYCCAIPSTPTLTPAIWPFVFGSDLITSVCVSCLLTSICALSAPPARHWPLGRLKWSWGELRARAS